MSQPNLEASGFSLAGAELAHCRTYFYRKSRGELQGHKVPQSCKVGTGPSHEVDDGGHLLHQGQGMLLAHPQSTFEPAQKARLTSGGKQTTFYLTFDF